MPVLVGEDNLMGEHFLELPFCHPERNIMTSPGAQRKEKGVAGKNRNPWKVVVGGTGFEPVTSTV
jgi:hypothetical protein